MYTKNAKYIFGYLNETRCDNNLIFLQSKAMSRSRNDISNLNEMMICVMSNEFIIFLN